MKPLTDATSSDKKSLTSALAFAMRKYAIDNIDGLLPVEVVNFDRTQNLVTVQPLISWVGVQDELIQRPQLANLNAISLGAGGFHISFPIKEGDLGWLWATDRDISQFKATLKMSKPNSGRIHTFETGLFIPDVFRKYTINSEDADSLVIQSTDGSSRIAIRPAEIKLTTTNFIVDAPNSTFTGNVNIKKTATIDIDTVTAGISFIGHGHISSVPGSRTSGGAIN